VLPDYDPALWEQHKGAFTTSDTNAQWDWPHRQNLLKWILDRGPATLLDGGCLRGHFYGELRRRGWQGLYTGVDVTPSFLADAHRQFPDAVFLEGNLMELDQVVVDLGHVGQDYLHDFHLVLCSELLQHLPDPAEAVRQCCKASQSAVVLSVQGLYGSATLEWADNGFIDRAFCQEDVRALCPDGWVIEEWSTQIHPRKDNRVYFQMRIVSEEVFYASTRNRQ
jgi:SAM-dependent methyltransferase